MGNKQIKVLHLHTYINISCGISKNICLLLKYLDEDNHVMSLGGDGIHRLIIAQNRITCLRILKYSLVGELFLLFKLFRYIKSNKIDLLHSHHRYFDFLSYIISRFVEIKTVTSVHSKVSGWKSFSYRSEKLIACSEAIKNHLLQNYNIEEKRITLINNFVEDNYRTGLLQNNDLSITRDQKIILFVGRFSREKGVDILLHAFRLLRKDYEKIFLIMIGSGEEELFMKSFIARNKLNALILIPQEDVNRYYKSADIIILPSRVDPFPLVMLEAGMMAKPFIGSDVDGIGEFIEHDKNGLLVGPGNVEELAAAIKKLLNDPVKASYLGRNLYEKVKLNCSVEKIIPKYLQLYKEILAGE